MQRKKYTQEFKDSTVQLVKNSDETVVQIAKDLGINIKTLYNWMKADRKSSKYAEDCSMPLKPHTKESLTEENQRLRKENRVLKQEREILKKATAYFAKETL